MRKSRAFTLIETLVVAALLGALLGFGLMAANQVHSNAAATETAHRLRQAGTAIQLYCSEHGGEFPRSSHSAFPYRQRGWAREILPYLGSERDISNSAFQEFASRHYRSPLDKREDGVGFGLNVYFELDPSFDDYPGNPQTWRNNPSLPSPARTILMAELKEATTADHVMAHFWAGDGDAVEVAHDRHSGKAHYLFADGHVERLALQEVFQPGASINRWNPSLAEAH